MTNSTDLNKTLDSQIDDLLLKFATSELNEMGVQQGAISENKLLFTLDEARTQILALIQTVGEGLIGKREPTFDGGGYPNAYGLARNDLRDEQRETLNNLIRGNK